MPPAAPPDAVVARLLASGCVFAVEEAAVLRGEARDAADLERMVGLREGGLPLEQVVGWAEFAGLRVVVAPGVFVPRRRTELLARVAAGLLADRGPVPVLVDLCCGTGAVAVAVASVLPRVEAWAVDVDSAAVACARLNLPPDQVLAGDLYAALPAPLRGRVDVVTANAPYVPTAAVALLPPEAREHEHRVALDGGPDGLTVLHRVIDGAPAWLAPGGAVVVEAGEPQVGTVVGAMRRAGLTATPRRAPEIDGLVVVGTTDPAADR